MDTIGPDLRIWSTMKYGFMILLFTFTQITPTARANNNPCTVYGRVQNLPESEQAKFWEHVGKGQDPDEAFHELTGASPGERLSAPPSTPPQIVVVPNGLKVSFSKSAEDIIDTARKQKKGVTLSPIAKGKLEEFIRGVEMGGSEYLLQHGHRLKLETLNEMDAQSIRLDKSTRVLFKVDKRDGTLTIIDVGEKVYKH